MARKHFYVRARKQDGNTLFLPHAECEGASASNGGGNFMLYYIVSCLAVCKSIVFYVLNLLITKKSNLNRNIFCAGKMFHQNVKNLDCWITKGLRFGNHRLWERWREKTICAEFFCVCMWKYSITECKFRASTVNYILILHNSKHGNKNIVFFFGG